MFLEIYEEHIKQILSGNTTHKAKIKASAWKTIRTTQDDNYEDYYP